MLNSNQSSTNSTVGVYFVGILEIAVFTILTSLSGCVFIFINCTMLFTLRSKAVFCETPRFVLVFNLLLADTLFLFQAQSMFLMAVCRVKLAFIVCFLQTAIAQITLLISPLTLLVMSLERYVAVCYPLRHSSVVTIRNTGAAIVIIWAFGFLSAFVQVAVLLKVAISKSKSKNRIEMTLKTSDFCGRELIFHDPIFVLFKEFYSSFWYVFVAVIITSTYISVMAAARSTFTNKVSAKKCGKTLSLHMVQLAISLCSPVYEPIVYLLSKNLNRVIAIRIQSVLYICVFMFPRCLCSLIYGLRDQTIRPALMQKLCGRKGSLSHC